MSKLTSKTKQKTSVEVMASAEGNICEGCKLEVDEQLREVKKKNKRERIVSLYCNSCFNAYMGRSSKFTITMPNSIIMWLDNYVKENKAKGIDLTASNAVRKGLELLKKKGL